MITQVYYRPHVYSPGYNPVVWSVQSDKTTETDFNYVFDIYVNGDNNYKYRLKQRPNPVGAGMVDVSSIITPYLNLTNFQAEEGSTGAYFENSDKIVANVFVAVGEEYYTAANGYKIYDGTTDTVAEPNYFVYSQEWPGPGDEQAVRITPASFNDNQALLNLSLDEVGLLKPYLMNTGALGAYGKFLKNGPNTNYVRDIDHHTLTFLNWNDYAALSVEAPVQLFKVDYIGSTGSPVTELIYNKVSNGGGPQLDETYDVATRTRETEMLTLKCGPKDIWPSGPVPSSYTVTAFCKTSATASIQPGATASETVTFTLKDYCEDIYPVVRLSWLNELGGRDYYNFDSFYEQISSSEEDVYSQTLLKWSSTTPVNVGDPTNNWLRGGNKSFNKTVEKEITIMSDWLTQEEIDFLGGIPESPSVWAYIGDEPSPMTVTITNLEYQYKKIKMVKLAQASFTMKINKIQIRQNL